MQTGFHIDAIESFKRRMAQPPKRQRMTTEDQKHAADVRRRREDLEEQLRLKREMEDF